MRPLILVISCSVSMRFRAVASQVPPALWHTAVQEAVDVAKVQRVRAGPVATQPDVVLNQAKRRLLWRQGHSERRLRSLLMHQKSLESKDLGQISAFHQLQQS